MLLYLTGFTDHISVLFEQNAVWQLVAKLQSQLIDGNNLQGLLTSLPLFNIESIYIDAIPMQTYQLSRNDLVLDGQILHPSEIYQMIHAYQHIIHFD